jgi:hypothetical protein
LRSRFLKSYFSPALLPAGVTPEVSFDPTADHPLQRILAGATTDVGDGGSPLPTKDRGEKMILWKKIHGRSSAGGAATVVLGNAAFLVAA